MRSNNWKRQKALIDMLLPSRPLSFSRWFCLVCCLLVSPAFAAKVANPVNFVFAGMELDVAPYDQAAKMLAGKGTVTTLGTDPATGAKVLRVAGISAKKTKLSADFGYSANGRLGFVTITVPTKVARAVFNEITKGAKAVNGEPGAFIRMSGRASFIAGSKDADSAEIRLETTEIHLARAAHQSESHRGWLRGGMLVVGLLLVALLAVFIRHNRRLLGKWIVSSQLSIADSAVAAFLLLVATLSPLGQAWINGAPLAITVISIFGYWRLLAWAIGATRSSRWIPGGKLWHSLLALPLTPVLVVPVVLRNAIKSPEYFGLLLFQAQLAGIAYIYFPNADPLRVLPLFGALAAGVVRLYGHTFGSINDFAFARNKWVAAVLTNIWWPVSLAMAAITFVLYLLLSILRRLWLVLICGFAGAMVDSMATGALIGAALAAFPLLFGAGVMGLAPTGYGNAGYSDGFGLGGGMDLGDGLGGGMGGGGMDSMSFDSGGGFDFNPANGLPMMGGMGGMDVHGNTFGTNYNDPI